MPQQAHVIDAVGPGDHPGHQARHFQVRVYPAPLADPDMFCGQAAQTRALRQGHHRDQARPPATQDAGKAAMEDGMPGKAGSRGSLVERRQRAEIQELKLALAEATVQLRIWQKGSEYVNLVPSPTSRPWRRSTRPTGLRGATARSPR